LFECATRAQIQRIDALMSGATLLGSAMFRLQRSGMLLKTFAALTQYLIFLLQVAQLALERSHVFFTTPPHRAYLAL
jgi:hypothetical protein